MTDIKVIFGDSDRRCHVKYIGNGMWVALLFSVSVWPSCLLNGIEHENMPDESVLFL